jgi:hypothetical protein
MEPSESHIGQANGLNIELKEYVGEKVENAAWPQPRDNFRREIFRKAPSTAFAEAVPTERLAAL